MMIRPDRWVIVEWTKDGNSFRKALVGFTNSQSWELSHIIDTIEDRDDYWEVYVRDGTMYKCMRHLQGMSPEMNKVYNDIVKKATKDKEIMVGILSI